MQGRALLGLAALAAVSCDQTVDLDFTRLSFTDLYVSGACSATPDLGEIELSFVLRNGVDSSVGEEGQLLPQSKIAQETKPVGELLGTNNIFFSLPQTAQVEVGTVDDPAYGEGEESGFREGVGLQVDEVRFDYNGGITRLNDRRLLVLLLDQSGTLIGRDPANPQVPPNTALASDRKDERITFLRQLVKSLPADVPVSLIPFNGSFADVENANPTTDRSKLDLNLADLARGEDGKTPLNDALDRGFSLSDQVSNDYVPSIVLFTDGLEDGDNSGDGSPAFFQQLTAQYAEAGFPVTVLHLQPPVGVAEEWRGRSPELAALACATGGQYIFLERADVFSESTSSSRLEQILRSRLTGTWRIRARSTLNNPNFSSGQGVFLSTEFGVSLGESVRFDSLYRSLDGDLRDNRLWIYKQ